ncbi:MAG TPA: sigma-E processing peptidase SpoIIGA [Bacillota bacterium]|nr:sigma-E processing peptidase SpoIIGA [Bacillota bacterium]
MEGVQYVYFEKVLFVNLSLNWIILWVTARLGRVTPGHWRLGAAALLGAMYSFSLLFPGLHWLITFGGKVAFSLLMVGIAFFPLDWPRGWRIFLYFYLTSFALGGAIIGLGYLTGELAWWVMPAVSLGALALGNWAPLLGRQLAVALGTLDFRLVVAGREKLLPGFVDTGNQVREPLSCFPVVIVEAGAVQELLPPGLGDRLENLKQSDVQDLWEFIGGLEEEWWPERWRVVPYSSVGRSRGYLLGFRPDYLEFTGGNRHSRVKEVIVALHHRPLSVDGNYLAILPADLINN